MPLDNTAEVETPEHVRFRYRVAGPVRRALAYLIDLLVRAAVLLVIALTATVGLGVDGGAVFGILLLAAFALEWGYFVLFEVVANGRSPGKRLLSLRVVKEGGFPIGFIDSVLRNLLRAADFLPLGYLLGLLSMAGDRRFRRLGDRVAGTMVVIEERAAVSAPLSLRPAPTPEEFAGWPQRSPLSAGERETVELLLRRSALPTGRRAELAGMIAPTIAQRMGVTFRDPVRFLWLVHHRAMAPTRPSEP